MKKDVLADLLLFLFRQAAEDGHAGRVRRGNARRQESIFFATGEAIDRLAKRPIVNTVLGKGFDVLLCPQDVDEFCFMSMNEYNEKQFKNVAGGDLGLETEDEKSAAEAITKENEGLFAEMQKALEGKVKRVAVSARLTDTPFMRNRRRPHHAGNGEDLGAGSRRRACKERPSARAERRTSRIQGGAEGVRGRRHRKGAPVRNGAVRPGADHRGLPIDDPVAYTQAVYKFMA